jgi:hypothetical protein
VQAGEVVEVTSHRSPIARIAAVRQPNPASSNPLGKLMGDIVMVENGGRFADGFALQGYDSVQLAAAHLLHVNAE